MPTIEIHGVRHWFVDRRSRAVVEAISHADLKVGDREFVSIVGPSGCGKTTLLNMVAGLVEPSEGRVAIDGTRVHGLQSRDVGYMFARDTLLPWRTVLGNVMLGLEFERRPSRLARAEEFVHRVGLQGFEEHYPDQLSHGMRQRVALARTLVREPKMLLMDEPFGALDAQTRILMQDEFIRLWEANQTTVLFVTHDLAEAIAMSDRVVVFSARPGHIKSEHAIDLPRPRLVDSLHGDPVYQQRYQDIWQDLKAEAADAEGISRAAQAAFAPAEAS